MENKKNTSKQRTVILFAVFFTFLMVVAPAGNSYGISQIKSWVNKIKPGTVPELDAGNKKDATNQESGPTQDVLTQTEKDILLSLTERKRSLDQRALVLNQQEEQLRSIRDNIQLQVSELKRLQQTVEASMDAKKAQDADKLNKVVSLYNGMDPRRSAEKLQALEPKVAASILLAMNRRKASSLLGLLPPENAKRIVEEIVRKTPAP